MDVAQDVITREDDCETTIGTWITRESRQIPEPFGDRLVGRMAALDVVDEKAGETIVAATPSSTRPPSSASGVGIDRVNVRSLTCAARHGVCRMCYGRNLATGQAGRAGRGGGHHRGPVDR